ncbi:unnamed protein product [Linum tenue]|uniref:Uncharacterized protein n=1 Tax=Linum tenue TaxID=586396 RepID=A0AAV0P7R0_9ROSI|nr:unnamed protein product [Linum tenue]
MLSQLINPRWSRRATRLSKLKFPPRTPYKVLSAYKMLSQLKNPRWSRRATRLSN